MINKIKVYFLQKKATHYLKYGNIDEFNKTIDKIRVILYPNIPFEEFEKTYWVYSEDDI